MWVYNIAEGLANTVDRDSSIVHYNKSQYTLLFNYLCSKDLKVKKAMVTGDSGSAVLSFEHEMKELKNLD